MKKFILAAVAASLVATPVLAAAPQPQHGKPPVQKVVVKKKVVVAKPTYRNWRKGERFDSRYARNYRQIDYRKYRGLKAPPRGYRYVQSGNDAVLVGITSGIIAAVITGAIR
ncbi:RcnB family protein [Sphingomonas sp. HITSZ_GF]|uniref:RcnB family protein n=1 Tax=Sphingomonas sp. HITSZ_GF TaxID=3037247 RepID=UPI00240D3ADF|nr:RcnB family protein [Sphingomonas sp. HITSZ_GF]MDG2532588.1 RcnB family protein [Sphingomonas sp. HITSZ_GF]